MLNNKNFSLSSPIKKKLLEFFTPTQIPYYPDLPSKGTSLTYLSLNECKEKFNCTFSEGIDISSNNSNELAWDDKQLSIDGLISGINSLKLVEGIKNIKDGTAKNYLAITKMSPEVGHGLFAIETIPKHTVLCIYSGTIHTYPKRDKTDDVNDYRFYTGNFYLSANEKRGIATFMQHLPGNLEPFGAEKNLYAVTNVVTEFIVIDKIPIIAIVAIDEIKKGEQIGFTYNKQYWMIRRCFPHLFDKAGNIVDRSKYNEFQLLQSMDFTPPPKDEFNLTSSQPLHFSFSNTEISLMIKKYKLSDSSQGSLEKGLRNAVVNSKLDDVRIFLKEVKNINAQDSNPDSLKTALHWAALKGNQACYQLLLDKGADINIKDAKGKTPMEYLEASLEAPKVNKNTP